MLDAQYTKEQNASRMAKAISSIPDGKFDLYSMMMDAVLLGASMARQAAQLPPAPEVHPEVD